MQKCTLLRVSISSNIFPGEEITRTATEIPTSTGSSDFSALCSVIWKCGYCTRDLFQEEVDGCLRGNSMRIYRLRCGLGHSVQEAFDRTKPRVAGAGVGGTCRNGMGGK